MNHRQIRYSTIALLAIVVVLGVGCTPATITANAPTPPGATDATTAPNSAPRGTAMPVTQMPIDLPGKPDGKGKPEDRGKPDDKGKPEDKGKPDDKGRPDDKGKPDNKGKP